MDQNGSEHEIESKLRAEQLYRETQDLEKDLRNILKKKNIFDKFAVQIRSKLRENYEKILFLNFEFAISKDIEQNLWKNVFYKVIEEYRKRIRKQATNSTSGKPPHPGNDTELQRVCESFKNFLANSTNFYHELIIKFQKKYNLKLEGSLDSRILETANNITYRSYLSCHRCLIFLGDLARYHRDLHGHSSQKDWKKATYYYTRALYLIPDHGNPHNQLAVLATYEDDEFVAVYHYLCSLGVQIPFLTAKENLVVLFEKNRLKYVNLQGKSERTKKPPPNGKTKGSPLKHFLIEFVRLHGILFTRTSLEQFQDIKKDVLAKLTTLLEQNEITSDLLLKMTVINVLAIYNIVFQDETTEEQKVILTENATSLALEVFGEAMKAVASNDSYLPAITVFLDFLTNHLELLRQPEDSLGEKTWNSLWMDLVEVTNSIASPVHQDNAPTLKEEIELRGLLAFRELYRDLPYAKEYLQLENDATKKKRLNKLWKASRMIAASEVGPPAVDDIDFSKLDTKLTNEEENPSIEMPPEPTTAPSEPESRARDESSLDEMEDEVILFKPGEGAKFESDRNTNHTKTVIGSERVEKAAESLPAYPSFDLFRNAPNELWRDVQSQSFYQPNPYSFFGTAPIQPMAPLEDHPIMTYWSSASLSGPSLFSEAPSNSTNNANNVYRANAPVWLSPPPKEGTLPFPFPGGQQQRINANNPFVS